MSGLKVGPKTNIKDLSIGGSIAILICGLLGYYQPDLLQSMPGAEAALTVIISGIFTYFKEPKE